MCWTACGTDTTSARPKKREKHPLSDNIFNRKDPISVKTKSETPKILQVGKFYPPHTGGMETHLQNLITGLASDYSVDVIVANDHARGQTEKLDGAFLTRVPSFGTIASMSVTPTLAWELSRRQPDLMHVHTPHPGAAFALSVAGWRGPLVVTHHADILGRRFLHGTVRPFIGNLMRRADRIIVTSRRYLETSAELRDYQDKCVVVPLGLASAAFAACETQEVAEIRNRFGDKLLLAVGRLVPYKGLEYAIRAMSQIDGALAIVGVGPLEKQLRELVAALGLTKKVHFLAKVCDLRPYYSAAKVFVLPSISRAEAFGIVQLEAMAAGLPVVNTDIDSGVPEVSIHGQTGLTVPPGDADALASALQLLLNSEHQRQKMGEAARKRAEVEYSVDKMVARTAQVYEGVLSSRRVRVQNLSLSYR
jgi:glycosyltransferase involved in cell wall biosynthesis